MNDDGPAIQLPFSRMNGRPALDERTNEVEAGEAERLAINGDPGQRKTTSNRMSRDDFCRDVRDSAQAVADRLQLAKTIPFFSAMITLKVESHAVSNPTISSLPALYPRPIPCRGTNAS